MKPEELAEKLREMYIESEDGEAVTMIHLFGVKYSKEIKNCDASPANLAALAGIPKSYGTEINKGCNLAKYVSVDQ